MKKLALLLGALSLVSSVAYAKEVVPAVEEVVVVEEAAPVAAAPALRVTNFGQFVEVDNWSGSKNGDVGYSILGTSLGLAYGDDWTFGVMARKGWDVDTDKGIHSDGHRIDLDVWRNFENVSVGARWRQEADMDRWLGRVKYNYGMFSGWVDAGYQFNNKNAADNIYSEGMPLCVTVGPVTAGYYYEYKDWNGTAETFDKKAESFDQTEELTHQVRLMFPLYSGEKLSLSGEYRYQFAQDKEYEKKQEWQEQTGHIGILNASYKVTENLSIDGYYRYDLYEYEKQDGAEKDAADNYYGEFCIGWNYTF